MGCFQTFSALLTDHLWLQETEFVAALGIFQYDQREEIRFSDLYTTSCSTQVSVAVSLIYFTSFFWLLQLLLKVVLIEVSLIFSLTNFPPVKHALFITYRV